MSQSVVRRILAWVPVALGLALLASALVPSRGLAQVENGRIAFQSTRPGVEGFQNVFTMNADGSEIAPLLPALDNSWDPAWSPDGTRLAFTSLGEEDFDVYVVDADGSELDRLTPEEEARDTSPAWSPGGGRIAFVSDRSRNFDIYTMNADGSGPLDVSDNLANDCGCFEPFFVFAQPTFSPSGARIAFTSDLAAPGRNLDIYTMNRDGTDVRRITRDPGVDAEPDFSPDGRAVVFQSDRDGDNELYVMTPAGRYVTRVTENEAQDLEADFSPDGRKLAFQSTRGGHGDIWVMDWDPLAWVAGEPTNLTNDPAPDGRPDWQPVRAPQEPPPTGEEPAAVR